MQGWKTMLINLGYYLVANEIKFPPRFEEWSTSFFDRVRLKDWLKRLQINCVLDVGANNGGYARNLRRLGYKGYIFSFEPNPAEFENLTTNFKQDPYWHGYNLALGSETKTSTLNISQLSVLSSFLSPLDCPVERTCEVEIKRLDDILDDVIKIVETPRIFLKIDTQGYDLEVLKGAEGCIQKILGLQSELSIQAIYENMPHYLDLLAFYESLGFQLIDFFPVLRSPHGNIMEYDCLMARRDYV